MNHLQERLSLLKQRGEAALIAFVMSAQPTPELSLDCIKAIARGGCDILEIGVPFSDPVADGEVIERFHHRGVQDGMNLEKGLDFARLVGEETGLPLVLFSYLNPILAMGREVFVQRCREAGIDALIIPDLPMDEMGVIQDWGLEVIPMVAPSSTDQRVDMVGALQPSFVYCVSVRGTTGVRTLPIEEISQYMARVRHSISAPLALGFGLSSPEQIQALRPYADGFVIGSHFVRLMEELEDRPAELLETLEKKVRGLKDATRI
ncbi:MAG TPA: tryptophan synthase subunit alpha [Syntrophomonadaceae bacterium]|nr:tryptophan synthase subunit alpha [Syntrophomonadaceae bacterium]